MSGTIGRLWQSWTVEGKVPGARLIEIREHDQDAPAEVKSLFDQPVSLIRRLRTVDGEPRLLVSTWVPSRLVPGLRSEDFPATGQDQSILRILADRFKLSWSRACETVSPCWAPPEAAAMLGIARETPILSQACTAFGDDQAPVFYDQVYRVAPITYNLVGARREADAI